VRSPAGGCDQGNEGGPIETFDPALVESARQGDRLALEALLRAARPHIRRYAERHCIAHAEDATQEALWTVYRKIPSLHSVAAFPAWLIKIVARICLGLVGPLWRRIEELKEADAVSAAEAISAELRIDVANAVDALPETYRSAILMHYYGDLAVADVATCLGITETAAKVRLHRGRERIRRHLADAATAD
jgi:RNA polymerase sigma factor (sigma-70 family)